MSKRKGGGRGDRLSSLQRLKEIREDQAKAEVARAEQARVEAEQEVAEAAEELEQAAQLPGDAMPPAMLVALKLAGWASAEHLRLAEDEYERTLERRSEAHRSLKDAAIGRRSIEKLANRREADAIAQRRDAAARAMDELYLLSRARDDEAR